MKKINIKEIFKFIVIFVLCVLFLLVVKPDMEIDGKISYIDMNREAELYYNDKLVCVGNVNNYNISNPKYGDIVTIKTKVNKCKFKNAVLTFNNIYNAGYEVLVDGKKIKSFGMNAKKDSFVANSYVIIPLKQELEGSEVEIKLRCTNEGIFAGIPSLLCMNSHDFTYAYIYSLVDYIFIAALFIEIGLLVLVFMCVNGMLKIFNMKNIYVGMIAISVGFWIMATFQIDLFFIDSLKLDFYLEYIALACSLFFCNKYVQELYGEEKEVKFLKNINLLLVFATSISIMLQEYNIVHMNDSIIVTHMIAVPLLILLLKKFFIEAKNEKGKSTWGIILETVAVVTGFIFYIMMHMFVVNVSFNTLNLIILVYILLIGQAILRIVHEMQLAYKENAETQSTSRLAYLDTLTGISNRRGLDKFLDTMKALGNENTYMVCSFDLNKLKHVNDTYGHAAGDLLIKSFAKELKSYINIEEEYCGRMGGDEFLALVLKDRAKEVLKKLKKSVEEKNKNGEFEYAVKYSVGTAEYDIKEGKDIHESIRLADFAMYEMKAAFHRREE